MSRYIVKMCTYKLGMKMAYVQMRYNVTRVTIHNGWSKGCHFYCALSLMTLEMCELAFGVKKC